MQDNLPELLSPKVDIIFKLLFGDERNKDLTINFISAVLGYKDGELEDISFYDTHLKREHPDDKLGVLDIKAKLSNGNVIDIEMQARSVPSIRKRISYYKSNMLTEQIGEGCSYLELKPVKSIIVADFDFIPESEKCHTVFQMLEKDEHFPFNDLEEIHVLCLKKLSKLNNERLREWLRFINSEKREEFMELAGIDPVFVKAVDVLATFSADDHNRMLYEARLKEWRDNKDRIDGALAERTQQVWNLFQQGYSLSEVEKLLSEAK
ncbi:MAG: Rpn family recombination-promoting nuclease/putative transposase [Fibromonadaceae bacterium]|jgi:predicted transposase/invertase (TIGR01784 family)|nr:Rpn family recombination-promoting nuclease/putative transposase [Fibromonadaceae bacterium]